MLLAASTLTQAARFRGSREFRLEDERTLQVVIKDGASLSKHSVELALLSSDPIQIRQNPRAIWTAAILFGICALALMGVGTFSGKDSDAKLLGWAFGVPALALTVLLFRKAFAESCDWLVFRDRVTGRGVVLLYHNNPDERRFATFVQELRRRISQSEGGESSSNLLTQELLNLAGLHAKGALSDAEFAAAKKRILGTPKDLRGPNQMWSQN